MARGYGPHYLTASSPGLVMTGANSATWAGRGIIVLLWELALVIPLPVLVSFPEGPSREGVVGGLESRWKMARSLGTRRVVGRGLVAQWVVGRGSRA